MSRALHRHWPEYLIEAWALGTFMVSAALFTALLEYPGSPIHQFIPNGQARRTLIGLAMGLTAIALIYSPWGQRSGAHMNPATTLTFLRLGKIQPWDAGFYIAAQFIGGVCGVLLSKLVLGGIIAHPSVSYVTTVPGGAGAGVAFLAEAVIACGMMFMVLSVTNSPKLARFTGLFAGALVFLYITFEAPLSGMSINPARTAGSALPSGIWTSGWIYFTAPVLGMMVAAQLYGFLSGSSPRACPKYHHGVQQRCIFCGHPGTFVSVSSVTPVQKSKAGDKPVDRLIQDYWRAILGVPNKAGVEHKRTEETEITERQLFFTRCVPRGHNASRRIGVSNVECAK